ncbi:MAG: DUF378 domain-containing protein [Minisyncoccota bacterium]
MKLHRLAFWLLIIGGLNWLLVAFGYGLDTWGISAGILRVVYILVGLSALYEIFTHGGRCKACEGKMVGQQM